MTTEKENFVHVLEKVAIFAAVERPKLMKLYDQCEIRHLCDGEYLIKEGTNAAEIYIVMDGAVSVILQRLGKPYEVASFGVGGCLGEASVIGIQNHSADVVVRGDSMFLVLTRELLMQLYYDDISLFALLVLNIARELARRLKETDHHIETGE